MRPLDSIAADLRLDEREAGRQMLRWWAAGVEAVDPRVTVPEHLAIDGQTVIVGERRFEAATVTVLAFGKAARGMAAAADAVLGDRIGTGLVVSDEEGAVPEWATLVVGDHPVPGAGSRRAAEEALALVDQVESDGLLLALVSGGGSALLEAPHQALEFGDVQEVVRRLIWSDAPIDVINEVRSRLSVVKAGRLAARSAAPVASLIISDVVGSDPRVIASGTTVGPPPDSADLPAIFRRFRIEGPGAERVLAVADDPSTRPPDGGHHAAIVADARTAAAAAQAAARAEGAAAVVVNDQMTGDTETQTLAALDAAEPGAVAIHAGETTVRVTGEGLGGRNQHAALVGALHLTGRPGRFLAAGTDGRDGPTDAAGALVDGHTVADREAAQRALAASDSHPHLDALGALIRTGRTGTNVGDLWIVDRRENVA